MKVLILASLAVLAFSCGKEEKEEKVVHHRHPHAPVVIPDQNPLPPLPPSSNDPSKKVPDQKPVPTPVPTPIPDQKPDQKPLPPPVPTPVPDQKPVPPAPPVPPVPSQEPPVGQQ